MSRSGDSPEAALRAMARGLFRPDGAPETRDLYAVLQVFDPQAARRWGRALQRREWRQFLPAFVPFGAWLAASAMVVAAITSSGKSQEAESPMHPAAQMVMENSRSLQQLGVCPAELRAQARLELFRADTYGDGAARVRGLYYNSRAQALDAANIPCSPALDATAAEPRIEVHIDHTTYYVEARQITAFDAPTWCENGGAEGPIAKRLSLPLEQSEAVSLGTLMLQEAGLPVTC